MPEADLVIYNANVVLFESRPVTRASQVRVLAGGEVAVRGHYIVKAGQRGEVRGTYRGGLELNAGGRLLSPGLVDMHTHAVFAGSRDDELEAKLSGVSYSEILRGGGGIYRTVRATRSASDEELMELLVKRLRLMLYLGTTTAEIKSGYSLDHEGELRLLRVAREASSIAKVDVVPTLLAHVPPEEAREGRAREDYVKGFANDLVGRAVGLASFVDVFCDEGAFTPEESRLILTSARAAGLGTRAHADQLARIGCAEAVAQAGPASVDHLEVSDERSVKAIAASKSMAGLLPASLMATMGSSRPPVPLLRAYGVPMALGSDLSANSVMPSMQTAIDLAVYLYGLTQAEALAAATANAALSLGLGDRGSVEAGKLADLVVWDLERVSELGYDWGRDRALVVIRRGSVVKDLLDP
ncbi:imidazolonepropionase [Acidilobus sp.]|uniref:imidazolonepropionase n=1 Tax=Acidilobus sp. TaxID=1872109 RepID=UPI003D00B92E